MCRPYDNKFISVTSHALDSSSPLSQTVTPSRTPSPLERGVLYGRPHMPDPIWTICSLTDSNLSRAAILRNYFTIVHVSNESKIISTLGLYVQIDPRAAELAAGRKKMRLSRRKNFG